jgi:hypothetical protein
LPFGPRVAIPAGVVGRLSIDPGSGSSDVWACDEAAAAQERSRTVNSSAAERHLRVPPEIEAVFVLAATP